MTKKASLLILFCSICTVGLAQLKRFNIEVPYNSKIKISDSIQSITLMNRSMSHEFTNASPDQIENDFIKKNYNHQAVILDSLACDTAIQSLGEILFNTDRFDAVVPTNRNINRYLPYTQTPEPLTWNYVERICDLYSTDALVVLENMAMMVKTEYTKQHELYEGNAYVTYYAAINVSTRSQWKMYDPKTQSIVADVTQSDSIFWDGLELTLKDLFNKVPSIKEAMVESAQKHALDFSNQIAPEWRQETRNIYEVSNKDANIAIDYVKKDDWAAALDVWKNYLDNRNKSTRSKIMLNIAVSYEMLGELEQAKVWGEKSYNLYYRDVSYEYLKKINRRLKDAKQ